MTNPYQSPESPSDDAPSAGQESEAAARATIAAKRRVLYWMLALAACSGLVAGWLGPNLVGDLDRVFRLATNVVFVILLLQWCRHDRIERSVTPWRYFTLMMVICPGWPIIMPFYFLSTRGFGAGTVAIAKGVAFMFLFLIVMVGVGIAAMFLFHSDQFDIGHVPGVLASNGTA